MARARNIKPGFFKNYDLADAGPQVQLLFAGLWCLADRDGRLEDKPRLIKAELFPYYEFDVNGGLTALERLKFICRYEVDDVPIIQVLNFKKHQSPHNTEKASVLPSMEFATKENNSKTDSYIDNGEPVVIPPLENDGKTPDSLIPDSLIHRLTDSQVAEEKEVAAAPAKNNTDLFDKFYEAYPRKENRASAEKAWKKIDPDLYEMIIADVINRSLNHDGWKDKQFISHPSTYLNQKRWNDEITPRNPLSGGCHQTKAESRFQGNVGALTQLQDLPLMGITHEQQ